MHGAHRRKRLLESIGQVRVGGVHAGEPGVAAAAGDWSQDPLEGLRDVPGLDGDRGVALRLAGVGVQVPAAHLLLEDVNYTQGE